MEPSTERILTTHTGSMPRPADMLAALTAWESPDPVDEDKFDEEATRAVTVILRQQLDAGLDVVNDGEMGKPSYATYIKDRLTGFRGTGVDRPQSQKGFTEFPDLADHLVDIWKSTIPLAWTSCDGPIMFERMDLVEKDIERFTAALDGAAPAGAFLSAASPGIIGQYFPNTYYPTYEEYLGAIAEAMQHEYKAIHEAGFVLQLDCPDLTFTQPTDEPLLEIRKTLELRVEALNHAVRDIPAEAMRLHVCWGNGEWPRAYDVPLMDIIDVLLKAKPAGLMVMAANGRHAHEWKVFEDVPLPDGKYLVPGVIDPTTNVIEHPEVVAQRLTNYAALVGKENLMAGVDCGFGTIAGMQRVAPSVVWAKFRSLRDGAELASTGR
jgi:5-methyltetrahydropteroyltriglutamate--homocysteine methyltransferase